jgi:hypothetical protein
VPLIFVQSMDIFVPDCNLHITCRAVIPTAIRATLPSDLWHFSLLCRIADAILPRITPHIAMTWQQSFLFRPFYLPITESILHQHNPCYFYHDILMISFPPPHSHHDCNGRPCSKTPNAHAWHANQISKSKTNAIK